MIGSQNASVIFTFWILTGEIRYPIFWAIDLSDDFLVSTFCSLSLHPIKSKVEMTSTPNVLSTFFISLSFFGFTTIYIDFHYFHYFPSKTTTEKGGSFISNDPFFNLKFLNSWG